MSVCAVDVDEPGNSPCRESQTLYQRRNLHPDQRGRWMHRTACPPGWSGYSYMDWTSWLALKRSEYYTKQLQKQKEFIISHIPRADIHPPLILPLLFSSSPCLLLTCDCGSWCWRTGTPLPWTCPVWWWWTGCCRGARWCGAAVIARSYDP